MGDIKAEIQPVLDKFIEYFNAGNFEGVASLYAEDCRVLPHMAEAQDGNKGVGKSVQEAHERGMVKTTQGWTEFESMGPGFAFSSGYWIWATKDGHEGGKFKNISIWKKVNGEWKIYRDIFNASSP